jgi:HEPN domain-containing protein
MREEVRIWLEQAKRDLDTAQYLFTGKRYKESSFYCQQAAEKGLKAVLISKKEKLVKIHDLVKLSSLVDIDSSLRNDCKELTTVYIDARYPDTNLGEYSKEETLEDLNRAERVLQWAEKNI